MVDSTDRIPTLSIVVTVVSGRQSLRRCLEAMVPQCESYDAEIIVPYDDWCHEIAALAVDFPSVRFHRVEDLGLAADTDLPAHLHRLYDRRRAVGLGLARGSIVAMTEDHAVPAPDWCQQLLHAHQAADAVIGGAIENRVDRPLNWAWYYCDFGRYGRPFPRREAEYVSDVNVSYKRDALMSVQELWKESYRETTVHWQLAKNGWNIILDPGPVVFQNRPSLSFGAALKERIEWGRVFAESRSEQAEVRRLVAFAVGTTILPLVLTARAIGHMRRQDRSLGQMAQVLPLVFVFLICWSWGEFLGYVLGPPRPLNTVLPLPDGRVSVLADHQGKSKAGDRARSDASASRRTDPSMSILTYHSLDRDGSVVSVDPDEFKRQVACIAESGFCCTTLQNAVSIRNRDGVWPSRTVVMTFDDAFENVYEHALPVLREHGFTATVFVISDFVGRANEWESPPEGLGRRMTMTWDQLETLAGAGWEIGAHTRTHPDLRLLSDKELESEIADSRSQLEQRLGSPVTSFAYPYGHDDDRSRSVVRREYKAACTTRLQRAGDESPYELPRVDSFYLRNPTTLGRLLGARLDGYLTLRRWGRRIRRLRPEKKIAVNA